MSKITKASLLLFLSLGLMGFVYSQLQTNMLENRLEVIPSVVKYGQQSLVKVIVKNPFPEEKITLKAVAVYNVDGVEYTTESNEVTLTIDRSMPISVRLNLGVLSYVANSAVLDGNDITPNFDNSNNVISFSFNLPNDNNEHVLQFKVKR